MRMATTPMKYKTPRMATKVHRNHFDSNVSEQPSKPFDLKSIEHTCDDIERLTAAIEAAQKQSGVYRFAIVNALRRSRRTYTTYDDLSQVPQLDEEK